ncbi:MAG: benzoylformate decarboxylase [Comamonadaceae bacterium]|nr:MAG: benzoylformate decarboxylase [Comamonadaceae bacterium]
MARTVREEAFDFFRRQGMTTVFGNPGSTELPMLADFPDDFRYVLGLQEAAVVGMADGHALATGRPTLVNLHTGPGLGNAVGAIVNARANRSPLVITAGQQVRPMMNLEALLSNPRATEMVQSVVKFAAEPARAEDVPAVLARATYVASTPPYGPVFVSIPMDDWNVEATDPSTDLVLSRRVLGRCAPDPRALDELVDVLNRARRPALVIGADVDATGGFEDAVALAERLGAAVFSPPANGRQGFPRSHDLYQGALPQAIEPVAEALEPYDVVLVIGAPVFRYYPYTPGRFLAEGTRLWQVTSSVDEAARAPMGDALVADPTLTLQSLVERVPQKKSRSAPRRARPSHRIDLPSSGIMSASDVYATLAKSWPADGVMVYESPSNLPVQDSLLELDRPRSFYLSASGGLGFGLPAAIGVALADSSRRVVAAMGDGSMQYSIQALATAATLRVPLTVLLLDNSEYAILKWFAERENTANVPGLDMPPIDHVALSRAYGVPAETARTADELTAALNRAFDTDGPHLIHVPIKD